MAGEKETKSGRIIWTSDEYRKLVKRVPALRQPPENQSELADLLDKAQKALPPKRRRPRSPDLYGKAGKRDHLLPKLAQAFAELDAEAPAQEAEQEAALAAHKAKPIYLKPEEWRAIAHHSEVKAQFAGKDEPNPHALASTCERVQHDVLPPDRQRSHKGWIQSGYRKGKGNLIAELRNALRYPPLPKPLVAKAEPTPEPVEEAPAPTEAAPTATPTGAVQHLALFLEAVLKDAFTQALNNAMPSIINAVKADVAPQGELVGAVRQAILELLGGPQPQAQAQQADTWQEPPIALYRASKPRVDVVGLLNGQAELVKKQWQHRLNLNFIPADHVGSKDVAAPDVVMVRKFVSHDAQDIIKKAGAKLHYANGGISSVLDCLARIDEAALTA
jgi:hypothetical protein